MAAVKRRIGAFTSIIAMAALVAAARAGAAVSVRDDSGTEVTLAVPAMRIVSLAPHATELLYAVGAGARIVGVIATSDFPPLAKTLPRVGDATALDFERILEERPDLVVTWPYTAPAQVAALRARGVAVFTTDPKTIDGIADDLDRLGTLVGNEAQARAIAEAFRARLARIRADHLHARRIRVFYQIWNAPLYTVGGGHLITRALDVCGADNVFAALRLAAPSVSIEAVLAAEPDAIIAGADGGVRPAWLDDWQRFPALPAVAHGSVYSVNGDLLHRAGPRFVDGVAELCAAIDRARAVLFKP
jgi:iron complex transport system substrate-binding protein